MWERERERERERVVIDETVELEKRLKPLGRMGVMIVADTT